MLDSKVNELVGYEHCHCHSTYSNLDSSLLPNQIIHLAKSPEYNMNYLTLTEHGVMGSIPAMIKGCNDFNKKSNDAKISPIFGCELYLNPSFPPLRNKEERENYIEQLNEEEKKRFRKNYHLTVLACSEKGYSNLVNLSSWAWINGLGGRPQRPRINYEQLYNHREGLIILSGCIAGHIARTWADHGVEKGDNLIKKYHKMFGQNFYLEIMLLDMDTQKKYNEYLIGFHNRTNIYIPIVLTGDCHFAPDDRKLQRAMMLISTGKTIQQIEEAEQRNEDVYEIYEANLSYRSERMINEYYWASDYKNIIPYDLFVESKLNSVRICEKSKGVKLNTNSKMVILPNEKERLWEEIEKGMKAREIPQTKEYLDRIHEEYNLICKKGFASYFLVQQMMIDQAKIIGKKVTNYNDTTRFVGPGRGSSAGSIVAYLLNIVNVDAIKHDLLFSRFLSENRGGKLGKLQFTIDPIEG